MVKRFSLTLDEEILAYIDDERAKIGVSRPAMISFMVQTYKTQQDALKVVNDMPAIFEKLEELDKKFDGSTTK